jgi:predicted small lipoprotein YifL
VEIKIGSFTIYSLEVVMSLQKNVCSWMFVAVVLFSVAGCGCDGSSEYDQNVTEEHLKQERATTRRMEAEAKTAENETYGTPGRVSGAAINYGLEKGSQYMESKGSDKNK